MSNTRSCSEQFAVSDVERLVIDQQSDDLAVGDVDDGLPVLGIREARFGIGQWPCLVETVQICARQAVGFTFLEVAAQPDVAVGQREQRLGLGHPVHVQAGLANVPRLDREGVVVDHQESSSSARSDTTTSAPLRRNSSA